MHYLIYKPIDTTKTLPDKLVFPTTITKPINTSTSMRPTKGTRVTAFNKSVRQKAHREGTLFNTALSHIKGFDGMIFYHLERRSKGRNSKDGRQWNSGAFISGRQVDDGELFIPDEDVDYLNIDFINTRDTLFHHTDITVSLLDIARPAKRKGVAKDFEVVQKSRNVIALDDDELEDLVGCQWEEDGWEQIYDEQHADEQRTYSSVLKGNES